MKATQQTLTVIRGNREWLVRHSDPEIQSLFGTDTLPTPYFLTMPVETVCAELLARNPNCAVLVAQPPTPQEHTMKAMETALAEQVDRTLGASTIPARLELAASARSVLAKQSPAGMALLPAVAKIDRDHIGNRGFYIWSRGNGADLLVVCLIPQPEDGITDMGRHDEWYFKHNLTGTMYGPFLLTAP